MKYSNSIFSFAVGTGNKNSAGEWLDVFFPAPQLGLSDKALGLLQTLLDYSGGNQSLELSHTKAQTFAAMLSREGEYKLATVVEKLAYSQQNLVAVVLAEDKKPSSVPEVYLKLHLLSHRLVKPNHINLNGMLNLLPQVVWTNQGAIDINELAERQLQARLADQIINVLSVDRLPQMANYIVPTDVSIADSARVYLGAYVGPGTVVMQEGFIDFNAGTDGAGMIKGIISTGFFVGKGSNLASGSASISKRINETRKQYFFGEDCYIGAHAAVGISLGDRCVVEAGLYITEDSLVQRIDAQNQAGEIIKAAELAGVNDLLFRHNSDNNMIEVLDKNKHH